MGRLDAVAGILDFFIPAEVLSAVLLVFTMENILDALFSSFVPTKFRAVGWIMVYILGIIAVSGLNYVSADAEDREELDDDLDDL